MVYGVQCVWCTECSVYGVRSECVSMVYGVQCVRSVSVSMRMGNSKCRVQHILYDVGCLLSSSFWHHAYCAPPGTPVC
jgi:hypothetical protein